jgi:hypothetical protein
VEVVVVVVVVIYVLEVEVVVVVVVVWIFRTMSSSFYSTIRSHIRTSFARATLRNSETTSLTAFPWASKTDRTTGSTMSYVNMYEYIHFNWFLTCHQISEANIPRSV